MQRQKPRKSTGRGLERDKTDEIKWLWHSVKYSTGLTRSETAWCVLIPCYSGRDLQFLLGVRDCKSVSGELLIHLVGEFEETNFELSKAVIARDCSVAEI